MSPNTFPDNPNEKLGFEINPTNKDWSFVPEFYPSDFTQMKKREFNRYGGNCGSESVSIKTIKNREFHVEGQILSGELWHFQSLVDVNGKVDLLSPLTPSGGMECYVKSGELGNFVGWDPLQNQRKFKYTLDLVSTGRDEGDSERNGIVSGIVSGFSGGGDDAFSTP